MTELRSCKKLSETSFAQYLATGLLLVFFGLWPATGFSANPEEQISELLETMSLSQLMGIEVTSASFFDTTVSLAPGSSYILDIEKAREGAFRTTRDLLYLDAPGIMVKQHSRHGTLVGMRGMWVDNNAKSVFMLDGHPLNHRMHYGYTAGLISPLLGDIQRLEIIRGPGAIRHGSGAINGFMNFIPKNGTDNPGGFTIMEYGGRENLWRAETGFGKAFAQGKDLFVYAGIFDADGFTDSYTSLGYSSNPGLAINPETRVHGQKRPGVRMSAYLNHGALSWNTLFQDTTTASNSDANSRAQYWHSTELTTRPRFTHAISGTGTIEVSAGLSLMEHGRESLPSSWGIDDGGGSELHTQVESIFRTTHFPNHRLAAGAQVGHKRFYEKNRFFGTDYQTNFESIDMNWHEMSLFAEDQFQFLDRLLITAGIRYDYQTHDTEHTDIGQKDLDNLSFRVAAALSLGQDTTLKAEYQQGFRTPDAYYYNTLNSLNAKGMATGQAEVYHLAPETMDACSASVLQQFFSGTLLLEATGFYNEYHDTLKWGNYQDVLSPGVYAALNAVYPSGWLYGFINAPGKVTTWGGEFSLMAQISANTEIKASYAYTRHSDEAINNMPYPRHAGKLGLGQYFFNKNLFVNAAGIYHSGQGDPTATADYLTTHNRIQVDASARYRITQSLSLKLLVQNLFKETVPPPVNWQPGLGGLGYDHRFWYLSLEYRF